MDRTATIIVVWVLVFISMIIVNFAIRKLARRRLRALFPTYGAWDRFRRQLAWRDKLRILRATAKRRPVEQPDLEQAQLAYVRFAQQANERSPLLRRPRLRFAIGAFYVIGTAAETAFAILDRNGHRPLVAMDAVLFAFLTVMWLVVIPRMMQRRPQRLARLRRSIEQHQMS